MSRTTEMASRTRRKPQVTYKSPTAEDHFIIILPLSRQKNNAPVANLNSTPSSSRSPHTPKVYDIQDASRRRYPMTPSLPLFHPFGHLAMSLPPLDPIEYGLPVPSIPDDTDHRPSARLRRPAAKLRETEEDVVSPTVSTIAAVAARERASPRKRRTGGAKRKRKDADDGDATYPAKRTRIPRGAAGQTVEDDAVDLVPSTDGATSIPEVFSDLNDASKRRSTRAKGSLKRRDSSASETTSISASANPISGQGRTDPTAPYITEAAQKSDAPDRSPIGNDDKEEKEEGELSEEHNS